MCNAFIKYRECPHYNMQTFIAYESAFLFNRFQILIG